MTAGKTFSACLKKLQCSMKYEENTGICRLTCWGKRGTLGHLQSALGDSPKSGIQCGAIRVKREDQPL
ncbi:hypothetical protein M4578_05445 [Salipiger sp. P9]|nr:hypothetical protein [Salipiger pentaromativorans]